MKATILSLMLAILATNCRAEVSCKDTEVKSAVRSCEETWQSILQRTPEDSDLWCIQTKTLLDCFQKIPCEPAADQITFLTEILEVYSPKCTIFKQNSTVADESEEIDNSTDISNVEVVGLSAEYLGGTKVLLTWNVTEDASQLDGFKVSYRVFFKSPDSPYVFDEASTAVNEDGLFSIVLDLGKKSRYEIQVTPYNSEQEADASDPIYIYVSGKPLGVSPGISLIATPLGSDAIVVSYKVLGDLPVSSINFFYKTEDDNKWTQVTKDDIAKRGDQFFVLSGLEAGTLYYIYSKSWLLTSYQDEITHVVTSDGVGNEEALGLTLGEARDYVDWSAWDLQDVDGFKVTVEFNDNHTEVQYLPRQQTRLYVVNWVSSVNSFKVQPFNRLGLKKGGELTRTSY
ncbi:hypothetical protein EGW08_011267 [Elysia chlorotica]|uniref:Fibronectin type-III domain-containing protein n=1 Tax=Elysia chlorotica TaxID=188477 RepID=A0A433THB6_ELYCH|nr:hypothetical protein EGW08_011267 [Elysia chlorotica]